MTHPLIHLRAGLRLGLVVCYLLAGALCVACLFSFLPEMARVRIKRRWSAGLVGALGVRFAAESFQAAGLGKGVIVANHISFLDIFVINALLPVTFVAKSDVAGWPLIGWLTARTGNLFIERGRRGAAHLTQQAISHVLDAGGRVVIFPEGTTTDGSTVLPFHAALLQGAVSSGVPVHCIALGYRGKAGEPISSPAYVDDDSLWDCLWRIVCAERIVASVVPAMQLDGARADRRQLAHHAHQAIAKMIADWQIEERRGAGERNMNVTCWTLSCHTPAEEYDVPNERTGVRHDADPIQCTRQTAWPCGRNDRCSGGSALSLEPRP